MAPEMVELFTREVHEELNRDRGRQEAIRATRQKERAQIDKKLDGLIDAIADGFRAPGLQAKLDTLEEQKATLVAELDKPAPSPVRLHPNLAQLYRDKVAGLQSALKDPALHDEAMEILRGLVDRVEMKPTEDGYEITLVGEIAHMISLSTGKSGQKADHIPSPVKVVAWARCSPCLLIVAERVETQSG